LILNHLPVYDEDEFIGIVHYQMLAKMLLEQQVLIHAKVPFFIKGSDFIRLGKVIELS